MGTVHPVTQSHHAVQHRHHWRQRHSILWVVKKSQRKPDNNSSNYLNLTEGCEVALVLAVLFSAKIVCTTRSDTRMIDQQYHILEHDSSCLSSDRLLDALWLATGFLYKDVLEVYLVFSLLGRLLNHNRNWSICPRLMQCRQISGCRKRQQCHVKPSIKCSIPFSEVLKLVGNQ